MKLNLASGQDYRQGYINIDNKSMYNGYMNVDYEADILTMDWEEDTVEEILLSHFAMYIGLHEMQPLLEKWRKWLKKDGKLVIETGNLKSICETILSSDDPNIINGSNGAIQLFGDETTVGHKWCWCPTTLSSLLYNAGFSNVEQREAYIHKNPSRDFLLVAFK